MLDLATGLSKRMDWGFTINFRRVDHRILRLSDDGNTLWSWGCVRNTGEGCTSRMYVIDVSPTAPSQNNWTNATLGRLGPGAFQSGLQDFTVSGQGNATEFSFTAYSSGSTSPAVMGVFTGNYLAGGEITWRSELQPVSVSNIAVDASDVKSGLLLAARPPVHPFPSTSGVLLLRGPLVGVGKGDGKTLTPTVVPWAEELPAVLRSSNMVQLVHQKPHRLLFTFGRANCISDEIWEVDLSTSTSSAGDAALVTTAPPDQLVSALLPGTGAMLQGHPDGSGGTQLSWVKCSSRIVFADVPESAAVTDPIDYNTLDYAWLDINSTAALRTVSRVDDIFIMTYSNGSIFSGQRKGHHIEQITLLSNDSMWVPLSATVHEQVVYIGERNNSGTTSLTARARIRSIDLSSQQHQSQMARRNGSGSHRAVPQLKVFLDDTRSVDDMTTMPASCVPESDGVPEQGLRQRRSTTVDE